MLDFVIDLLIFFIITAVFVKESGLTVNRPAASPDDTGESWNIMIFDDGAIFLDNRRVDARAVRANVERMTAGRPDRGVMIVAQNGVPTGTLVNVVDQAHLGGIQNVTFATTR
jgi:biopolymer transport protein ExbD